MRHQKSGRKLGRNSSHRKAMFSNMVASLIEHGRIETTEAKAKELRGIAEKTITWAVNVAEIAQKKPDSRTAEERVKLVHAKRMAQRVCKQQRVLDMLFSDVGPTFKGRPGGYTRVLKTRFRKGDAAKMAYIELVTNS